jgi:hypothetical protein
MTENITLYDKNKNPKRFPIPTMGRLTEEGYEKYQAGESWPIKWDSSLIEIMMDIERIKKI